MDTPEIIAASIEADAVIERSIFGTDDPDEIWRQVLVACPDAVDCFHVAVSVGALFGLRLHDGSSVALKVHRETDPAFLDAIQRVQRHLVGRGFPSPRPLGRRGRATLEEWHDVGVLADAHRPEIRSVMAQALAELIRLTQELGEVPGMRGGLPAQHGPLWPVPHNVLFDFEATADGAEWIDEIASAAKRVRDEVDARVVVAHGDWSVKHFRFDGLQPTAIYDWDSLTADRETVLVGTAAHSFTYVEELDVDLVPSVAEARAFVAEYEQARGAAFSPAERRAIGAAAVYGCAYGSRCSHAVRGRLWIDALPIYAEAFL